MVFNPIFFENTNDASGLNYFASPQKIGKSSYLFSNILNVYISDVSSTNLPAKNQTEQSGNLDSLITALFGETDANFSTNEILQKVIPQNDFNQLMKIVSDVAGEASEIDLEKGKKFFFALSGKEKIVMFSAEKEGDNVEIKSFASSKKNKSIDDDISKFINSIAVSGNALEKIAQVENGENKVKIFAVSEEKEIESGKISFDLNSWDVLKKEKSAEKYSWVLKKEKVSGKVAEENSKQTIIENVFTEIKKSFNEVGQLLSEEKSNDSNQEVVIKVLGKLTESEKALSESLIKQTPKVNGNTEIAASNAYSETLKEIRAIKSQVENGKISLKNLSDKIQKLVKRIDEISVESKSIERELANKDNLNFDRKIFEAKTNKIISKSENLIATTNENFTEVKKSIDEISKLLSADKPNGSNIKVVKQVLGKLTESERVLSESLIKQTPKVNGNTEIAASNAYSETLKEIRAIKSQVENGKISLKNLSGKVQKMLAKLEKFSVESAVTNEAITPKEVNNIKNKNRTIQKIKEKEIKIASNNVDKKNKVEEKSDEALSKKKPQRDNFIVKNDIANNKEKPNFEQKLAEHVKTEKIENQLLNNENKVEKVIVKPQSVEQNNLIKHLAKIIQQREKTTIEFQLKPEHLGKVKVALDLINDTVKANITVDNVHTKQMLENNLSELHSQLQKSGVLFKDVNISLSNNGNQNERYARSYKENKKNSRFKKIDEIIEIENSQDVRRFGYNTYEYLI